MNVSKFGGLVRRLDDEKKRKKKKKQETKYNIPIKKTRHHD